MLMMTHAAETHGLNRSPVIRGQVMVCMQGIVRGLEWPPAEIDG
jgi:hypothetical protein